MYPCVISVIHSLLRFVLLSGLISVLFSVLLSVRLSVLLCGLNFFLLCSHLFTTGELSLYTVLYCGRERDTLLENCWQIALYLTNDAIVKLHVS